MPKTRNDRKPKPDHLAAYIAALKQNCIQATARKADAKNRVGDPETDAWLRLRGTWGEALWACELKNRIERGTVGPIIHRMKQLRARAGRALLLTEYVTPPLAEELRNHDVAFVDVAGNAFLKDKGLYVWVTHMPQKKVTRGETLGLHAAGMKLLYVLLLQRARGRNLRDLAADAGIALGGVARILNELERRNWIRRVRDGVEIQDATAMLKRWDEGYADTLRPKLLLKTCRRKPGKELTDLPKQITAAGMNEQIFVGGELGAAVLTRNLRPETATLHLDGIDAITAMKRLELLPDEAGDVALIQAFGRVNRAPMAKAVEVPLADPLLVRGELLLRPDDRLQEVAEGIRVRNIVARWS